METKFAWTDTTFTLANGNPLQGKISEAIGLRPLPAYVGDREVRAAVFRRQRGWDFKILALGDDGHIDVVFGESLMGCHPNAYIAMISAEGFVDDLSRATAEGMEIDRMIEERNIFPQTP